MAKILATWHSDAMMSKNKFSVFCHTNICMACHAYLRLSQYLSLLVFSFFICKSFN